MGWSSSSEILSITLVRHGQASYLEGDRYDRLSETGERQARRLGEFWSRRGTPGDRWFSGPAERHTRTAAIVAGELQRAGREPPETIVLPEFDEFPGEELMRVFTPVLMERDARIRSLAEAFEETEDKASRKRILDDLFPAVAERWVDGEVSSPDIESWPEFVARVSRGLDRIREQAAPGEAAVVFTSAGPTAVTVSLALEISPRRTLELTFSPRNASLSEIRCNGERISLSSFNSFSHLDEPELLTYR